MARKVIYVTCAKITSSTNRRKTGCKSELFFEKKKNIFSGGEAVVEPWEDELLWDDDFSDEEEDTEKQIENGSNEKFGQRLCGGWRKPRGRNPIF